MVAWLLTMITGIFLLAASLMVPGAGVPTFLAGTAIIVLGVIAAAAHHVQGAGSPTQAVMGEEEVEPP